MPGDSVKVAVEYMQPLHYDAESNNYVLQLPTHIPVRFSYASAACMVLMRSYCLLKSTAMLSTADSTEPRCTKQRSHVLCECLSQACILSLLQSHGNVIFGQGNTWMGEAHTCLSTGVADTLCCCVVQFKCLKQGLDVRDVLNCVFTVNTGGGLYAIPIVARKWQCTAAHM